LIFHAVALPFLTSHTSETRTIPESQSDAVTKCIQKIIFSLIVLVADPKALDLIHQVVL
jgi:hypothetical protein